MWDLCPRGSGRRVTRRCEKVGVSVFYGKANDLKHYEKIARHVMELSPRHKAFVDSTESVSSTGEKKGHLEIKVYVDFEHVGHRFWVSPFAGPWHDTWIYVESVPKKDGEWVDVWKDTAMQIGWTTGQPMEIGDRSIAQISPRPQLSSFSTR